MRLLHVTDLHFNQSWFTWLRIAASQYDVCCLSGDLLDIFAAFSGELSLTRQAARMQHYLEEFPAPLFVASGNHDEGHDFIAAAARRNPRVRADGTDEDFLGYRFVCQGWNSPPTLAPKPAPTIVLRHAPPAGSQLATGESGDVGELATRALALSLPAGSMILSGHAHTPAAWCDQVGSTACFNPGVARRTITPARIIIDTDRGWARQVTEDGARERRVDLRALASGLRPPGPTLRWPGLC